MEHIISCVLYCKHAFPPTYTHVYLVHYAHNHMHTQMHKEKITMEHVSNAVLSPAAWEQSCDSHPSPHSQLHHAHHTPCLSHTTAQCSHANPLTWSSDTMLTHLMYTCSSHHSPSHHSPCSPSSPPTNPSSLTLTMVALF